MVFNCPKAATQHRNQHKQPYYEASDDLGQENNRYNRGRQTKDKNFCVNQ